MPPHGFAPMPRRGTKCFPASIVDKQQYRGASLGPQHPHIPPQLLVLFIALSPQKHLHMNTTQADASRMS